MDLNLNSLRDWLRTPAGQNVTTALEHQEREDTAAKRQQWTDEIRVAETKYREISPSLLTAERAAAAELEAIKKNAAEMIRKAEIVYAAASRARLRATMDRDLVVNPAAARLHETASPRIAAFVHELESRRRTLEPEYEQQNGRTTGSNARSIQMAAHKINQIITTDLPKLELEALSDEDLTSKLQQLEASIPEITMEKII